MCTDAMGAKDIDLMIRQHSMTQRPLTCMQCKDRLPEIFKEILNKIVERGAEGSQEDQRGKPTSSPFASDPIADLLTSLLKDRTISTYFFINDKGRSAPVEEFLSKLTPDGLTDQRDYWRARCVLQPIRHSATYNTDLLLLLFELKKDVLKALLNLAYHDCAVDTLKYLVRMLPPGARQIDFAQLCKDVLLKTFDELKEYEGIDETDKEKMKVMVKMMARIGGIVELLSELNQKWFPESEYFTTDEVTILLKHVFYIPHEGANKFVVDELLSAQRRLAFYLLHYVALCVLSCLFFNNRKDGGFYLKTFIDGLSEAMPSAQIQDGKVLRHFLHIFCRCLCILSDIRQAIVTGHFSCPAEFGYNYVAHRDDNTGIIEWASLGPTAYLGIGGITEDVSICGPKDDKALKMETSRSDFLTALGDYVDGFLDIPKVKEVIKLAEDKAREFNEEKAPNRFDYVLQFCLTRIHTIVYDMCFAFASYDLNGANPGALTATAKKVMKKLFELTTFEKDCKEYVDLVQKLGDRWHTRVMRNPRMVYVKCVAQKLGEFKRQEPELKCIVRRFMMFGKEMLNFDNPNGDALNGRALPEISSLDEVIPNSVHEAIQKACS